MVNIIIPTCNNINNKTGSSIYINNFWSAIQILWSYKICRSSEQWFKLTTCSQILHLGLLHGLYHVTVVVHKSSRVALGENSTYKTREDYYVTFHYSYFYLNLCAWNLITIVCNKMKKAVFSEFFMCHDLIHPCHENQHAPYYPPG